MTYKKFQRRPEAVGFVAMLLLSLPFALLVSEVSPQTWDWLFVFLFFIVQVMIFSVARWKFWYFKPAMERGVEKVEYYTFWTSALAALAILFVEYLVYSSFNFALLGLLAVGFLPYSIIYSFNKTENNAESKHVMDAN